MITTVPMLGWRAVLKRIQKEMKRWKYYYTKKELIEMCGRNWNGKFAIIKCLIVKTTAMLRYMRKDDSEPNCYTDISKENQAILEDWLGMPVEYGSIDIPPEKIKTVPSEITLRGTRIKYHSLWAFRKLLKDYYDIDYFRISEREFREREKEILKKLVDIWCDQGSDWLD